MPVLKTIYFTCWTKCFPKTHLCALSSNSKLAFHTCSPLNLRKRNIPNLEKHEIPEHVTTPKFPQQFGRIVSLDPDEVESYYDKSDIPKKENKKSSKGAKSLSDDNDDDEVKKASKITSKGDNTNDDGAQEDMSKLNFKYKRLEGKYTISSLLPNLTNRNFREKKQEILLEGSRLINEGISAGLQPKMIFFSRVSDVENLKITKDVKVYKVSYKELKLWSCNTTCPGIMGVFKLPNVNKIISKSNTLLPITVICDNIREPGNLGAIMRVAVGVGCKKIIFTKGCTDLWNPKVLRSACGAHFKTSYTVNAEWSNIEKEITDSEKVIIADNRITCSDQIVNEEGINEKVENNFSELQLPPGNNLPIHDYTSLDYKKYSSLVCILGGETHGISRSAYEFGVKRNGERIYIPMSNGMESLNSAVALGVILFEARRQMVDLSSGATLKTDSSHSDLPEEVAATAT